jgi:hypothetical protein
MVTVSSRFHFTEPVGEVWDLIADLGMSRQLPYLDGLSVEVVGEGLGAERTVSSANFSVTERVTWMDESNYDFNYTIVGGTSPLASYAATMRLCAGRNDCTLTWLRG